MFKVGDLVVDKTAPEARGIIVEVNSMKNKKSKNTYTTYLVHWFDTEFRSSHGPQQLVLIT
jgi:hypothetical protein